MKRRILTIFIVCLIPLIGTLMVMPVSATTVTPLSDADTHMLQNQPDDTHGDLDHLYVLSRAGDKNRRALIHFDLSSIPSGATIESATLHLRILAVNADRTHNVHRVTASWTEAGATWNSRDGTNAWGAAGGDYESTVTAGTSTGITVDVWVEWDVKSDVQAFVSGTSNYGWLIKDATESADPYKYVKYYSKEETGTDKDPYLEVTYTTGGGGNGGGPVAVPEFSPVGLIALIGVLSVLLAGTTVCGGKRRQ